MKRLERLVNLLAALIDTDRPLSRAEIHQRIPGYASDEVAFRRAFERDKETLREMGLPLLLEPLDGDHPELGDGYRTPREKYGLPDPGLTADEMRALAMAASAVKLKSQAATAALMKLGGVVHEVTSADDVALPLDDNVAVVFAGCSERRRLRFQYKDAERHVDPHRLSYRNGHWYLSGFDHDRNDQRTYRMDRIIGEIISSDRDAFAADTPDAQPWLPPWQMGDGTPVHVTVLVDAEYASLAIAQTGTSAVKRQSEDGSVLLQLDVTNPDALNSLVLDFLDHAEIVAPQEFRDNMRNYISSLVES